MAAYIIAQVEVTDPSQYEEYRKWSTAAMKAHGVEILARGGRTERLEGRDPGRVVVLGFPSFDAARAFYDSPEYERARRVREGAAIMNMLIVEGL
ncbi:MAG: DUF1330 domain-containing protein [Burkholderiaceae bacterium]|jgi:uncharacterized protein (DUF1330 family)